MGKHRYQAVDFKKVNWAAIDTQGGQQRVAFAVDVAKDDFAGMLMRPDRTVAQAVKWLHPEQSPALVQELVETFGAGSLEVVMEPTGTYGDSFRRLLVEAGVTVYRLGAKQVHDAAEIYDGVPSLHDVKAAYVIGRLHWDGVSRPWEEPSEQRRALAAQLKLVGMYKERYQSSLNRLEALLSRHWPEAIRILEVGSVTLTKLLATYGDSAHVAADAPEARALIRRTARGALSAEKIGELLASASNTIGVPCIEAERSLLQTLAQDLADTRQCLQQLEKALHTQVGADPVLGRLAPVVGKTTSAVLVAAAGTPLDYPDAASYVKGFGLNLKERSSGKYQGQVKITKRGPSVARLYLYFAALRQIRDDPIIGLWYQRKVARDGQQIKGKAITAIMRKLTKALWHVARGGRFDPLKLFNLKVLAA